MLNDQVLGEHRRRGHGQRVPYHVRVDDLILSPVLRGRGHRLTRARQVVWEVLNATNGHLTVEQIADRVKAVDPGINLASVYRALTLFAELELARESRLGTEKAGRWEPAHPDETFHLVCSECGNVTHHGGSVVKQVRSHLREDHSFHADTIDLVVTGRCQNCALD